MASAKSAQPKAFTPKVKKQVTLPLWKWQVGKVKYFKIEGEIFEGKAVSQKGTEAKMEPAHLMNVTDLETGQLCQVIVGTVLEGILKEEYPDGYVGLGFAVTQEKVEGKRYKTYTVSELEL